MKSAIITGADGFIGRHLVEKMLDEGIETFAVTRNGNNNLLNYYNGISNFHQIVMDSEHISDYYDIFPDNVDVMYHLVWSGVSGELRNNFRTQFSNINITMAYLNLAADKGIKRVILPGSTNEYLYSRTALNKNAFPTPSDAYGSVKVALRYLCAQFAKQHHIEFIYTIITGIYAADRHDNNVISYTINKLLKHEKPSLTKLEQLWDYVYIDDVIDALIAIGKYGHDGAVYSIGHGDNWPLANYIKIIHESIDSSLPLGIGEKMYEGNVLPSSCVDLTDIERDTGFVPRVKFEDGIMSVINRMKSDMEDSDVQ